MTNERAHNDSMNIHIKHRVTIPITILLSIMALCSHAAFAEENSSSLIPPEDPKQSITYWKKYTLDENNPMVERSQQVFSVLLRAWDQSRIEPGLYVVESEAGAWAASLADGNILLSKQAIETSFSFGQQRGEHLLAFILAHELAHQRADDLWHQRFFRMIGTHSAESQEKMMAGLELDSEMLTQLEQKEAQADHDGLVLMSSVGFDPHQIVTDKDFFTLWVENIWNQSCIEEDTKNNIYHACKQAQARALRTQAQLKTVATQSMLYELGVQEFVAGNYEQARNYFTIYGRDYPGRAIISAIGLSYFAQAQDIQQQLIELEPDNNVNFYYPMILDAQIGNSESQVLLNTKRANTNSLIKKLQKQKMSLLNQAIDQFEKAIRLAPDYRRSYILLASAHLLANNSYRVRGVLQGQYLPRFGKDSSVDMLLALTSNIEGNVDLSIKLLNKQVETLNNKKVVSSLPENVLRYSVFYNLAELYKSIGKTEQSKKVWMNLAQLSKKNGDTLLFRLALNHINQGKNTVLAQQLQQAPSVNGKRLGDKIRQDKQQSALWIDGERYQILLDKNSRYITQNDGTLISAWQNNVAGQADPISDKLKLGDPADRPFKTLGIPDRRLNMTSGEYLAYDDYGLAVRISNNQVKGWFLYDAQ